MSVNVRIENGKFFSSWLVGDDGEKKDVVTRNGLLSPEFGEEYAGTELECSYIVHKNYETRKLTELEVKFYRLSVEFPEAYSKISDVLRVTNPTVLAVMVHLTDLIKERKEEQRSKFCHQIRMLQFENYKVFQDFMRTVEKNDQEIWELIRDI